TAFTRSSASAIVLQFLHWPQKSCIATRSSSWQWMALASICASVYLPRPGGPQNNTACGRRSRRSIPRSASTLVRLPQNWSKPMFSPCPGAALMLRPREEFLDRVSQLGLQLLNAPGGVEHANALWFPPRNLQIPLPNPIEKLEALL